MKHNRSSKSKNKKTNKIVWNKENEWKFMMCLLGHKVVGIEKHFHMAIVHDEFNKLVKQDICGEDLWLHLASMYDLGLLEDQHPDLPWKNGRKIEFSLIPTRAASARK